MMLLDSGRRILCVIMACMILPLLPSQVSAQGSGALLPATPGLKHLKFQPAGGPAVGYAISIPDNYSPSKPAPLILALHFGVGGGEAAGAGGDMVEILIGPGLAQLGATSSRRIRCAAIGAPLKTRKP